MRKFYINGDIITLDRRYNYVDVVVTEDEIITNIGDKSLLNNADSSEIFDLNGNTLLPGFVVASSLNEKETIKRVLTLIKYFFLNFAVLIQKLNI